VQGGKILKRTVPAVITLDIHSYPHTEKEVPLWLEEAMRLFDELSIKATFFFPAVVAEQFSGYARRILKAGHEVGCHGLAHGPEEQYHLMPHGRQKAILCEAKNRIEDVLSKEVISFRSPAFKINGDTVRALEESGFKIESSVNPQRLGIFSSDVGNVGWMYSPRKPYHPSYKNPFRRGQSKIWEVPLSSFILPFMANTGIAFGRTFMKLFLRLLLAESMLSGGQIVYMLHPEDIYSKRDRLRYRFRWRHLLPSRTHGFEIRQVLFCNKCPEDVLKQNINLLEDMKAAGNAKIILLSEMLDYLEERR